MINLEYITHSGNDMLVVNAARTSFAKSKPLSDELTDGDINLLKFLADGMRSQEKIDFMYKVRDLAVKNDFTELWATLKEFKNLPTHFAPFAHPHITVRETVPLFVARQRFKHSVGWMYSEESRRYIDTLPELFEPEEWRGRPDKDIKQGSQGIIDLDSSELISNQEYLDNYNNLLAQGVAPELARMKLPQSMMVTYVVTGSLYAFHNAYVQRSPQAHAQHEIQMLAKLWGELMSELFPYSWEALNS